jgi:hypothetical protein
MELPNKDLEIKIKRLLADNKVIEAVALVQKELQLGLKASKDIVDYYRNFKI